MKPFAIYILVFALIQPGTMYVCLRVLNWSFYLSAFIASALAAGGAWLAATAVKKKPTSP